MPRVMTIWLPRWPVQRRLIERPEWRKRPVFVCRREARGLMTVASWAWVEPPKRRRAAIQPGMPLAEGYDAASFKQSLIDIDTTDVAVYRIELEKTISNAEAAGMDVTTMMQTAIAAGVTPASLTSTAVKFYPATDVVALAILGGGDAAEIINLAFMSGAEPGEIEAGALAAGVDPGEASTLVNAAKNLLIDSGEPMGDVAAEEEAAAMTPGEEIGAGEPAVPNVGGPVGGDGPGSALPLDALPVGGEEPAEASPS